MKLAERIGRKMHGLSVGPFRLVNTKLLRAGWDAAESVVHYVAPVGQKQEYVERARAVVQPYLPGHGRVANLVNALPSG